jgi:hypothetical protein
LTKPTHHRARFWKLLDEKYTNWEKVKERLAIIGADVGQWALVPAY